MGTRNRSLGLGLVCFVAFASLAAPAAHAAPVLEALRATEGRALSLILDTQFGRDLGARVLGRPLETLADAEAFAGALTEEEGANLIRGLERIEERVRQEPALIANAASRDALVSQILGEELTTGRLRFVDEAGGVGQARRRAFALGDVVRATAAELQLVQAGKTAVQLKDVDGSAWPEATAFRLVQTTPEHLAAVFSDPALQTQLLKKLGVNAAYAKGTDARSLEFVANFVLKPAPFVKISYSLKHRISQPTPGVYRLDWELVAGSAEDIDAIKGYALFESQGDGTTMLTYHHFVNPRSKNIAKLLRGAAADGVKTTAEALADFAAKEFSDGGREYQGRTGAFSARFIQ